MPSKMVVTIDHLAMSTHNQSLGRLFWLPKFGRWFIIAALRLMLINRAGRPGT
jgi:hypothetical protein